MGNTLIQDSDTGNIMGLNPGFIPIGMKEHGGIMYIASVDKEGNGEIGTIPSPIIRDFYKDRVIFEVNQTIPINVGDAIKISNKLYPADKFITNLQMEITETDLIGRKFKKNSGLSQSPDDDPNDIILGRDVIQYIDGKATKQTLYTPVLSYNSNISKIQLQGDQKKTPLFSSKGIYSLELYSRHDNSSDIPANSLSFPQIYQHDGDFKESNYWYLHTASPTDVFPKDLLTATLNQDLKQFPSNNKPGYLAVKLQTEGINKFDILPRAKEPFYTPITYKSYSSASNPQYYTYFPGFYYSTNSGIYIDRIEARIIDESTAHEMPLEYPYMQDIPQFTIDALTESGSFKLWKGIYLSSPTNLSNLFKNAGGSTDHMYNTLSNALPQIQSVSDNHSFILTTLKSITDHNQTDMESSTEGENKTYGGVFCVPLGEKYNNWYRAEIDYYDQYNNKQGTFTKRFNPYLNDVFGTNLSVDNYSYGPQLKMGNVYNTGVITKSLSNTIKLTYKSDNVYIGTSDDTDVTPSGELSKLYDTFSPFMYVHDNGLTNQFTSLQLTNNPNKVVLQFEDAYLYDLTNPTISYLYDKNTTNECLKTILNNVIIEQSSNIRFLHPIAAGGEHIWIQFDDSVHGLYDRYEKTCGASIKFTTDYLTFAERRTDNRYYTHSEIWDYPVQFCSKESDDNFTDFPKFGDPIACNYMDMDYLEDKVLNTSVGLKITIDPTTYRQQIYPIFFNRQDYVWPENPTRYEARILYIKDNLKEWYTQQAEVIHTFTASIQSSGFSISPLYSITPYFCLTGTNDEGKQVYVQRFGKTNDTDTDADIVYEHNFELDINGEPVNYYVEPSKISKSVIHSCTYTHEHPFDYYTQKLSYTNTLQPGIYVLNIQRVPGTAKAQQNTVFHQNAVLKIDIGNISKSFNADTGWLIQPTYSEGITNTGIPDEGGIEVYSPIVILVPNKQQVKITTDKDFFRQNIGLYKIKTCSGQEEIQNLITLQQDMISSYCTYMSNLAQTAQYLYPQDKVKEYNFMQKYGVFFKESYVFIDGLVDQGDIVGIKVDQNYQSYPFIPSDPSILPISISPFDQNDSVTTWNAYVMPESVLNVSDDKYPNFVFSNPINELSFSTEPLPGNLRQLVEQ